VSSNGLRKEGKFPADTRFQVTLPSPMVSIMFLLHQPEDVSARGRSRLQGRDRRLAAHGAGQGLIDLMGRVANRSARRYKRRPCEASPLFKRLMPYLPSMTLLTRPASPARQRWFRPPCGLGMHLCYGQAQKDKHAIEPIDAQFAGRFHERHFSARVTRSIDWNALPSANRGATTAAYFAPLKGLKDSPGDRTLSRPWCTWRMAQQAQRGRIQAAQGCARQNFGVASECGLSSTTLENYPRDARYASQGRATPLAVRKTLTAGWGVGVMRRRKTPPPWLTFFQ